MKRWQIGSQMMVTVNSIFAAFTGALMAVFIASGDKACLAQVGIALGLISFILFALAAEKITDALDESDLTIYLRSMLVYNVAVVLLLVSLGLFLLSRGYRLVAVIPFAGCIYPWLYHVGWLLFAGQAKMKEYVDDLSADA